MYMYLYLLVGAWLHPDEGLQSLHSWLPHTNLVMGRPSTHHRHDNTLVGTCANNEIHAYFYYMYFRPGNPPGTLGDKKYAKVATQTKYFLSLSCHVTYCWVWPEEDPWLYVIGQFSSRPPPPPGSYCQLLMPDKTALDHTHCRGSRIKWSTSLRCHNLFWWSNFTTPPPYAIRIFDMP